MWTSRIRCCPIQAVLWIWIHNYGLDFDKDSDPGQRWYSVKTCFVTVRIFFINETTTTYNWDFMLKVFQKNVNNKIMQQPVWADPDRVSNPEQIFSYL